MKRLALGVGAGVAALALLALAALALLPYLVDLPRARALIAGGASRALGRPVRIASASARLLPLPAVELRGVEVAEDPRFGEEPFATLERGFLRLHIRPLLSGRLEFGSLRLDRPVVRLVENESGQWNVSSLGAGSGAPIGRPSTGPSREPREGESPTRGVLFASGVVVDGAEVTYVSRRSGREYRLTEARLRLRETGTTLVVDGDAVLTPGEVKVRLSEGKVALGDSPTLAEAPLQGKLAIEGTDVGPLAARIVPGELAASGSVAGDLLLAGALGSPRASGSIMVPRLVLNRRSRHCSPPERTLAVDEVSLAATLTKGELRGYPVSASTAGGSVSANLTATLRQGLRVALTDIEVRGVQLERVLRDFLCDGYAVSGRLDLSGGLAIGAPTGLDRLSGDGRFSIGRGKVLGAQAVKLFADAVRAADAVASLLSEETPAPFEFESITGTYRIREGVASTSDLLYVSRGLNVRAAGTYRLGNGDLDLDLIAKHRRGRVRAKVTGTTESPRLRVQVLDALHEVEPRKLERDLKEFLKRFR